MKLYHKLYNWLFGHALYVIADAADNSVTLSRRLFKHMGVMKQEVAKVYVFYIPSAGSYGFVLNPSLDQPTQLCDIQYNSKYHCIGFQTLVPTVNRIFYDYGINHLGRCKLSVKICQTVDGMTYYQICHNHGKSTRK